MEQYGKPRKWKAMNDIGYKIKLDMKLLWNVARRKSVYRFYIPKLNSTVSKIKYRISGYPDCDNLSYLFISILLMLFGFTIETKRQLR